MKIMNFRIKTHVFIIFVEFRDSLVLTVISDDLS